MALRLDRFRIAQPLEVDMPDVDKTIALMDRLETALRRLETEGFYLSDGCCCACCRDVATSGHLPTCYLGQALTDIEGWRNMPSPHAAFLVSE